MKHALSTLFLFLLLAGTLFAAQETKISFAQDAWNPQDWTLVKSPRWPNIGSWKQCADHIENAVPADATKQEMLGKRAPETYTSMLWNTPITGNFTVETKTDFNYRMAPLIVLTEAPGASADGYPEYREHWEVVLYDQGINVWHHECVNGRVQWHLAAMVQHTFLPDTVYTLSVSVKYKSTGPEMTVRCGDLTFAYTEHDLPKQLRVGITGCEGVNRFYDFTIRQ